MLDGSKVDSEYTYMYTYATSCLSHSLVLSEVSFFLVRKERRLMEYSFVHCRCFVRFIPCKCFYYPSSWVHNALKISFVTERGSMSHCCSIMFCYEVSNSIGGWCFRG